ncbi:MAG: hypothetical protein DHS20C10_05130 [marine bacterium B5-7]|nr:MAG: hypothetical protein DHS20C10_05130 [marine bacterium B5-7]
MQLRIHVGFMPEEVSAKLKPCLDRRRSERSIIIISRDDPVGNAALFEQPLLRYKGLCASLEQGRWASLFSPILRSDVDDVCETLTQKIERHMDFDIRDYRLADLKCKLKDTKDGRPPLTVMRVGQGSVSDIFFQLPEMGFQPNLSVRLAEGVFQGVLDWLATLDPNLYGDINLDIFGAGGSVNASCSPGSMHAIQAVFSIRRLLKTTCFTSKLALKYLSDSGMDNKPGVVLQSGELLDHFLAQEVSRYILLVLASDLESYSLSRPYLEYLKRKAPDYRQCSEKVNTLVAKNVEIDADINRLYSCMGLSEEPSVKKAIIESLSIRKAQKKQIEAELKYFSDEKKVIEQKEIDGIKAIADIVAPGERRQLLRDLLARSVRNLPPHSVSCSAGMFLDAMMKRACNKLFGSYVSDANMEDDICIELDTHLKKWVSRFNEEHVTTIQLMSTCRRVHCDPYCIPDDVVKAFKNWACDKKYSLEHYVSAVVWGVSGFDQRYLPETASWDLEGIDHEEVAQRLGFRTTCKNGQKIILDPFWREIATDLLDDIISGKAFPPSIDQEEREGLAKEFVMLKDKLMFWSANGFSVPADIQQGLEKHLKTFLNKCSLRFENEANELCYQVWIRQGSWGGNAAQSLFTLAEPLDASRPEEYAGLVDRAFYVSTNIVALQQRGKELIEQQSLKEQLAQVNSRIQNLSSEVEQLRRRIAEAGRGGATPVTVLGLNIPT